MSKVKERRHAYNIAVEQLERHKTFQLQTYKGTTIPVIGTAYFPVRQIQGFWQPMECAAPDLEKAGMDMMDDSAVVTEILEDIADELNHRGGPDKELLKGLMMELSEYHLTIGQIRSLFEVDFDRHRAVVRSQLGAYTFDAMSIEQRSTLVLLEMIDTEGFGLLIRQGLKGLIEEKDWQFICDAFSSHDRRHGHGGKMQSIAEKLLLEELSPNEAAA